MQFNISWTLPEHLSNVVQDKLSADGQRYMQCDVCHLEVRIPQEMQGQFDRCPGCHREKSLHCVVHACVDSIACSDCGTIQERRNAAPGGARCPTCQSTNVEVTSGAIAPSYPALFKDIVSGHMWGEEVSADANTLLSEMQFSASLPDFPQLQLLYVRFIERLRLASYGDDVDAQCVLQNVEANLLRDYYRRTRVLEAGIRALTTFEHIVSICPQPFMKAAVQHNAAMAAYSLLAKSGADLLKLMLGDIDIRARGVAAAEAAIKGYTAIAFDTQSRELARVNHLLGDLLSAGNDRDKAALEGARPYYDKALQLAGADPQIAVNVRVSRINICAKLGWPPGAKTDEAVRDLETLLAHPEVGRIWPQQHEPRVQLASYYLNQDRSKAAVVQLEHAASLALRDMNSAIDETSMHARTKDYLPIFSTLAATYAKLGRANDTLGAIEALRGATIRLHTMSQKEKQERLEGAAKEALRVMMGDAARATEAPLCLPSVAPLLKALRGALPNSSLVVLDVADGTAALIVDSRRAFFGFGHRLILETWKLGEHTSTPIAQDIIHFRNDGVRPGATRERDLHSFFERMDGALFGRLRAKLKSEHIHDVIIITPGPLYGLPVEVALTKTDSGKPFFSRAPLRVRYLPSLGVAADLIGSRKHGNGRLLIVGYAGDDLPGVKEEMRQLQSIFDRSAVVMEGTDLNKRAVLAEIELGYEYVHFCCHGSFDELQPERSALHLSGKFECDAANITAADLRTISLSETALVTLSACSSGVASVDVSNDLYGLTGSILRAGAGAIVGSRWPVSDSYALKFMTSLYQRLHAGEHEASLAFEQTSVALSVDERLENWAAFSYMGL